MRAAAAVGRRINRPELAKDLSGIVDPGARRDRQDNLALRLIMSAVLQCDATFIDVGAHVGAALADAVRIAPRGRHLAFEPVPDLATGLRARFPQVDVREVALSDRSGNAGFTFVTGAPGMSGLIKRRDLPRQHGELRNLRVRLARLDDEIDRELMPALIKIDVEGAEVNVLTGARDTLRRARPLVVFEYGAGSTDLYGRGPAEAWDFFSDLDYRLFDLDGNGPFDRATFEEDFTASVWNYVAVPIG